MSEPLHDPAWHYVAIIYQPHVKALSAGSNGDGFGTLRGLIEQLDLDAMSEVGA